NLTQKIILPDTKLEIKDETYDAISCIGSFSPGQIRPIVLKELIRITKCGGLIILTSRDQKESNSFISELRSVMQSLEKAGQMKILKFNRELQGYKDLSESSEPPLYCCAYCLQVL
uniref:Methyltransferase type 11 domain-containing protein n=1 Tax=Ciona savignyi TaxID=51511 RepID=H2Z373_CIOSA